MMSFLALFFALLTNGPAPVQSSSPDCSIRVDAAQVLNKITPWMTGSCIEDVNHEIYGGLYAQQIFGESFEEPPGAVSPLPGWTAFGGQWSVRDGACRVEPDAGAKLVRDEPKIQDGTVECDVRLTNATDEIAGLIVRVTDPHTGADNWSGYEISINRRGQGVFLGRHHNDWTLLKSAPAKIDVDRWYRLSVTFTGSRLDVRLDNKEILNYVDTAGSLPGGAAGVRTWNSSAAFRNFRVVAANHTTQSAIQDSMAQSNGATADQVSGMWKPVRSGSANARFTWDASQPYNSARSQEIEFIGGQGTVGVANEGLNHWGIAVKSGQNYSGSLYIRQKTGGAPVLVGLQSADGTRTYARKALAPGNMTWEARPFTLKANATDPHARFVVLLDQPDTVWVDEVYLSPTRAELFHGLPVRRDIGDSLVTQGLTFLRYGGSMVNAPTYRWKQMIGTKDKRPQVVGNWYPYSTNGFGIEEFVQFCEAAHIEPAFAINIDETPEDAADLVEYLNGPASSMWGRKRAENGHPNPYHVHYIEIGNEEAINGDRAWYARYLERFKLLEPAMHTRDHSLQLVVAAWWRPEEPICRKIVEELNGKAALWDVHIGGDGLHDGEEVDRVFTDMEKRFQEWSPGTNMKAAVFEENGGLHDMQRALGHAHILNVTERHGDFVKMDCPANCLQPLGQNDNGWDQGQVFFTPDKVWGMPPFYAQQMAARSYLPLRVQSDITGTSQDIDVTATRSIDGHTLILKVVNLSAAPKSVAISVAGFSGVRPEATVTTLSGDLKAVNTPDSPEAIRSKETTFRQAGEQFDYDFLPLSYTILRLRR